MAYMKDSTGRRLDSFPSISADEVATLVAAGALSSRLGPIGVDALPAVTTDLPTVTWGTSATVTGRVESPMTPNVTRLGRLGTWDAVNFVNSVGAYYSGRDFFLDGDTFEFGWREQTANQARFHIFVDGAPVTETPYAMNSGGVPSTTSGGNYFTKLTFGTAKRRRITIYSANINGWGQIRVPATTSLMPAPPQPRIAVVGDSFCAGSSATEMLLAVAVLLGRLLGVDVANASFGGTGYVNNGSIYNTFGSTARVNVAVETAVEMIVIIGSVNDGISGLSTAAEATFSAYAAAAPAAPIIVFGVQPSNATDTISSSRATINDTVRQVAIGHPSVIAFHDIIGIPTSTPPAAYSSSATYGPGDRVTYLGSVWRVPPSSSGTFSNSTPGSSLRWQLETYLYTGTGKQGSPAGDGTRDSYLHSDGIHPLPAGSLALAQRFELDIRADIAALSI